MFEYILGGKELLDISLFGYPERVGWYQPTGEFALGFESFNRFVYMSAELGEIQIYRNLLVTSVIVDQIKELSMILSLSRITPIHLIRIM